MDLEPWVDDVTVCELDPSAVLWSENTHEAQDED